VLGQADASVEVEREWFNPAACFIGFREAMEACVIMSVMLNMLDKTDNSRLKKWVWYGAGVGLLGSALVGGICVGVYYAVKTQIISDEGMKIFEGIFSLLACIFLTYLGIGFLRFADIERKWSQKLFTNEVEKVAAPEAKGFFARLKQKYGVQSQAINTGEVVISGSKFGHSQSGESGSSQGSEGNNGVNYWTIFLLTFSAVFREGLETFIFLGAVGTGLDPTGTAIGGIVGIIAGIAFGWVVFWCGKRIGSIGHFFAIMTTVILVIAAGLLMYGAHEFEEVAKPYAYSVNHPIIMRPLWDLSGALPDGDGIGAVFRALVGYQDKPTLAEATVYLAYWQFVIFVIAYRYKHGVLFMTRRARDQVHGQDKGPSAGSVGDVNMETPVPMIMAGQFPPYWGQVPAYVYPGQPDASQA